VLFDLDFPRQDLPQRSNLTGARPATSIAQRLQHVIHSASVAVSRERKRAKTDRLDAAMLMRVFLGWLRGERGHCGMVAIPTMEEEDARRVLCRCVFPLAPALRSTDSAASASADASAVGFLRFVRRLHSYYGEVRLLASVHHRLRFLTFPMRTVPLTLARLGIRGFKPHLRKAPERLAGLRTAEGTGLPANIIEEFRRLAKPAAPPTICHQAKMSSTMIADLTLLHAGLP
jgi:transposase